VTHLDRDRLVLIAIGDDRPDEGEEMHLAACDVCHDEVTRTDKVADLARHSEDLLDLPTPSNGLWDRIAVEAFTPSHPEPAAQPAPSRRAATATRRAGWRPGPRLRLALVAALALVLGIAGTAIVNRLVGGDHAQVVARADLLRQPSAPPGAHGTVEVVDTGHGLQLRATMSGMPTPSGYYTVWLFDGGTVMIPVGSPGDAPLNIPASATNLDKFHIVDISAQQLGQQEHGTSMLQGTLHR